MIEKLADIQPEGTIRLVGNVGDVIKKNVTIIPEKKYKFKITTATTKSNNNIKCELAEQKPDGYLLTIENIKKEKGRYYDVVSLKTTSKVRPEISIRVYGEVNEKEPQ